MHKYANGFTLIEISIVLIVIGLITGGILTGRDLADSAAIRAQIIQLTKFNTAVHTFQVKYGYLPGDIPDPFATRFGFGARGIYEGEGDGNGIIIGIQCNTAGYCTRPSSCSGEAAMFWQDLSNAQLVEGGFISAISNSTSCWANLTNMDSYIPSAKIGNGNYVYMWSNGMNNYYGISAPSYMSYNGTFNSSKGLSVLEAYKIDEKVDDGLPVSGRVTACYISNGYYYYAVPSGYINYDVCGTSTWDALPPSSGSCFDNGNANGGKQQYSLAQNNGSGINCGISVMMQ